MDAQSLTLARRRSVVERCDALVAGGELERYAVQTWPRRVVLDGPNDDVVGVYERFRNWAVEEGVSLAPAFERRSHDQRITGEHEEVLSFPAVAVAVFEDGRLAQVAPHVRSGTRTKVDDVLEALEGADHRSMLQRIL